MMVVVVLPGTIRHVLLCLLQFFSIMRTSNALATRTGYRTLLTTILKLVQYEAAYPTCKDSTVRTPGTILKETSSEAEIQYLIYS
jgi:hypothetical protein